MKFGIVIEEAGNNYSAYVPDLPGCIATGDTQAEAKQAIISAIKFHLDGLKEDGIKPLNKSIVEYVDFAG